MTGPNLLQYARQRSAELMFKNGHSWSEAMRMTSQETKLHPLEIAGTHNTEHREAFEVLRKQIGASHDTDPPSDVSGNYPLIGNLVHNDGNMGAAQ